MKRPSVITIGLLVIALAVLECAYVSFGQSDAGWTTLIDGATGLDNWNRVGDANWRGGGRRHRRRQGRRAASSSPRIPTRISRSGRSSGPTTPRTAASSSAVPILRRSPPPTHTK